MTESPEPNDAKLVAYLDESRKPLRDHRSGAVANTGEHYAVAAAVLLVGDCTSVREQLHSIAAEFAGAKPLRWKDLSTTKRPKIVEALVGVKEWDACIFETRRPFDGHRLSDARVRSETLHHAFTELSTAGGVTRAVLETRSQPIKGFTTHDERDHRLLASLLDKKEVHPGFRIEHRGKDEPLLWLADVLAGARTDYLCWADRDTYPILGHRVSKIGLCDP